MSGSERRRHRRRAALVEIAPEIADEVTRFEETGGVAGGGTVGDLRLARELAGRFPEQTVALAHWRFATGRRDRLKSSQLTAAKVRKGGFDLPPMPAAPSLREMRLRGSQGFKAVSA